MADFVSEDATFVPTEAEKDYMRIVRHLCEEQEPFLKKNVKFSYSYAFYNKSPQKNYIELSVKKDKKEILLCCVGNFGVQFFKNIRCQNTLESWTLETYRMMTVNSWFENFLEDNECFKKTYYSVKQSKN